jgi:chromosome segregation ATPase
MKHLAAIACLALAACAPKAPPANYRPQSPVPEAASPQPFVDGLREANDRADSVSSANAARGETVAREAATLKAGISKATAEADRLRKQKAATEKELDSLWQMLTAENARAAELFAEAERHRLAAAEERRLRTLAGKALDELQGNLNAVMSERALLRIQLADAEAGSHAAHLSADQQHRAASKAQAAADRAKGAISVWRNIAFGFIGLSTILILILIYKPRFL